MEAFEQNGVDHAEVEIVGKAVDDVSDCESDESDLSNNSGMFDILNDLGMTGEDSNVATELVPVPKKPAPEEVVAPEVPKVEPSAPVEEAEEVQEDVPALDIQEEVLPETLLPETLLADTPADIPPPTPEEVVEELLKDEVVEEEVEEKVEEEVVEEKEPPTYDEAFPPLGGGVVSPPPPVSSVYMKKQQQGPAVRTKKITVVFHIAAEELNKQSVDNSQTSLIKQVTADTQTSIEITSSRDGSITVMVCGKAASVNEAKVRLQKELQTSAEGRISIPKDHHKNIIGKSRANLMKLEKETGTKIEMPMQVDPSNEIVIRGTKEGIARAMHKMKLISEEQFSNYRETVCLPRKFFPWITGGNGRPRLDHLKMKSGCTIHVPPVAYSDSNEVVVCGEKDKVMQTIAYLENECKNMEENFSNIQVEVREPQHKYIKGKNGEGIQEIFDATDIWVEMPTDASTTIKLLGLEEKLSSALSLVFEKANSIKTTEIDCDDWLIKFVIGKGGANIKKVMAEYTKSNISCSAEKNLITIDAPPEELQGVKKEITDLVSQAVAKYSRAIVKVDQKLHKHLIGKAGANINKIKKETEVNIKIPPSGEDDEPDDQIVIVGPPEGVAKAKEMILEQAAKLENEGQAELDIEQKWHRIMIGQKGENIQKIRVQYPEVQVSFPSSNDKTKAADKVILRGPKDDVAKVSAMMKSKLKEIIDENYAMKVPILKQHHRFIIGKAGINIRKIKEETNTRIDLPSETDVSNMIVITGRKEDVDAARFKLLAIQSELEGIHEEEVKIDPKLHNNLIGSKGRIIRSLIEESGDVQIKFPSSDRPSDNVVIRGIKEDVLKAKDKLLALAHEKELDSYCVEIECKTEYHRFLIGRKGINVNKLRAQHGCNLVFPRADEKEQDTIMIMGRKEGVDACAAQLKKTIKELENTMDDEFHIDKDFFKKLATRSNINDWENEFGGIKIVPKPKVNSVLMSGPKDCVIAARAKLEEMIEELQAQVETVVVIPNQYHRDIIGQQGKNVKNVTTDYQVQISFPHRVLESKKPAVKPPTTENGVEEEGTVVEVAEVVVEVAEDSPQDMIRIVGRPENCEGAKAALLALVPVTEEVPVPFEYHRKVIGSKGEAIRKMMDLYNVNIKVPPPTDKINFITVRGTSDKVQGCKEALLADCARFDLEKEDRILQSFKLNLTVDHRHHPKIIGKKGVIINKIRDDYKVNVQFPPQNSQEKDLITISGYEKNTEEARDAIMRIVSELEDRVKEEIDIDCRVHARLIGQRGKSIRKVMEKFNVDIRFPAGEQGGNTITIEGNEKNVEEAKEHLLELAEEYMEAVLAKAEEQADMNQYVRNSGGPQGAAAAPQAGFFVRGAPWQAPKPAPVVPAAQVVPDSSDNMAFPSLGGAPAPVQSWGWNKGKSWK